MALGRCTECGHEMSTFASSCPNCGSELPAKRPEQIKCSTCKGSGYYYIEDGPKGEGTGIFGNRNFPCSKDHPRAKKCGCSNGWIEIN